MSYALLIYSLKAGACLAVFYLFFRLLLSRETFHAFNRLVLLGGVAVSFLLPLCVITVWRELPPLPADWFTGTLPAAETPQTPGAFDWRKLSGGIYAAGVVVTLLRILWSLAAVRRLIRRGRCERLDDGTILVHVTEGMTPFSWGHWVVVSEEDLTGDGAAILAHERAHVRLHHTADLLLIDLAGCLQWFNPAVWLLRRELRTIHEYEADEAVLRSGVDLRSYQLLLVRRAAGGRELPIANHFNPGKLKKRIAMMLQKRSSRRARARILLLLPLVGLALGAFARTRYVIPDEKETKEVRTVRIEGSRISTSGIEGHPLILVDGERVGSLDSIPPGQIASVTVRKDSLARATYGEEARDGVILVTLRKSGKEATGAAADSLAGAHAWIESSSDGTTRRITLSRSPSTLSGSTSASEGQPTVLVDGKPFHGDLNTLSPDRIARITVYKGANVPEEYRRYVGTGTQDLIVIEIKSSEPYSFDDGYFRSDAWKRAQKRLSDLENYFESDAWKEAQKRLSELDADDAEWKEVQKRLSELNPDNAEWKEAQKRLSELGTYFQSDEWQEAQRRLRQLPDRMLPPSESAAPGTEPDPRVSYNTIVGGRGGMVVTGPEVMSKSRTEEGRSVSIARGRVTADFSEIDEADYRIEIDGRPATMADLERIEPGKIRRVESTSPDAASNRKGLLRVRTRK